MKKSRLTLGEKTLRQCNKLSLIMKMIAALILIGSMHVSAGVIGQNKISIKLEKTEITKVLKAIEKQGAYRFLYNSDIKGLKQKVTVEATNADLHDFMPKLLAGKDLAYKIVGNNLVVIFSLKSVPPDARITGRVLSETGEAVAGASITVKGTKTGTYTDITGSFSLLVSDDATLVISAVGYETVEVSVAGKTSVNVTLKQSAKKLDEVVVIGYGTASKRDLTGSIVKIKGDVVAAQPNTNPLASLQGKIAGVNIVNTAIPGATPDIRIRGTISRGTIRPVYIIDGIFNDNIDFVNPSEIESIEVLKDPSSLAIFGIKSAAGAILITTKKAKAGQVNINFNSTYGIKQLVDKIPLANANEFRSLATFEANNRVEDDPSANSYLNFINNVGVPGLAAFTGNTDWIDAVTRTAKFSTTNLSVDGSTEKNRFHFGLGYIYDEGLVKHVRYDRINLNINDEFKISKKLKIGFGLIGSKERLPYNSGALENARRSLPIVSDQTKTFRTKDPYGIDTAEFKLYSTTPIIQNSETNPLATLENNWDKKIDDRYRMVGNFFVDYNITKDLNLRSTWYADMSWRNNREYTPLYDLYDPTATTASLQIYNKNSLTAVRQDLINTRAFQQDYIATYKKLFADHSITATAGFTTYYNYFEQVSATVSQKDQNINIIPNDKRFWYLTTGFGDIRSVIPTNQNEYTTVSGLARLMYNYKGKYFLNGSFRRDGASQINREYKKKFQNFWAVGAAWEISKESFLESVKIINFLKLKASTGVLGNFTTLELPYPAYPTFSTTSSAVFGDNLIPVYVPDYLFDPNLKWETVNSSEIGIETELLNNRLHFEADYYYKKTKNLIVLFNPSGVLPTLTNNGSISNKGFEFVATWSDKINNDLSYSIGGNLTTYKNKVLYLPFKARNTISSSEQTPNQAETGYPIGYFYGLIHDGIYQSYADILASPVNTINGGGVKPGDIKYKDLDGNGVIDDNDRTSIGNPTPDFTYAVTASVKYKNFDLSIDLNGTYGNEIYRVWGTSEQKNSVYNYPKYYTEAWTGAGTSNWVPIVNQTHLVNRAPSTYGIEDGSYLRIRNLTISYTLSSLPSATYIKNLRLSLSVQNLKTWKRNLGYSPEFAGDAFSSGIDFGGAGSALPRIITVGLNVNF
ncbi:MAG TPA: TonB-dependent receptor [Chitinophagaceae bacterium]|nr:TonB-dependent receptor [Chitinophagaceae bacterium]